MRRTLSPAPELGAIIRVRVQPRASRQAIEGGPDGGWRVRVPAPPVDGSANRAVIALLASALGVPAAALNLVHGARGRDKLIRVAGMGPEDVARRLGRASAAGKGDLR